MKIASIASVPVNIGGVDVHIATLTFERDYIINSVVFKKLDGNDMSVYIPSSYIGLSEEAVVADCLANGQPVSIIRVYSPSVSFREVFDIGSSTSSLFGILNIFVYTPVADDAISIPLMVPDPTPLDLLHGYYQIRSDHYGSDDPLLVPVYHVLPGQTGISIDGDVVVYSGNSVYFPVGVGSTVIMGDPFIVSACVSEAGVTVPSQMPMLYQDEYDVPTGTLLIDSSGIIKVTTGITEPIPCKVIFTDPDGVRTGSSQIVITALDGDTSVQANEFVIPVGNFELTVEGYDAGGVKDAENGYLNLYTLNGVFIFRYKLIAAPISDLPDAHSLYCSAYMVYNDASVGSVANICTKATMPALHYPYQLIVNGSGDPLNHTLSSVIPFTSSKALNRGVGGTYTFKMRINTRMRPYDGFVLRVYGRTVGGSYVTTAFYASSPEDLEVVYPYRSPYTAGETAVIVNLDSDLSAYEEIIVHPFGIRLHVG